jgi:hypothetical protein
VRQSRFVPATNSSANAFARAGSREHREIRRVARRAGIRFAAVVAALFLSGCATTRFIVDTRRDPEIPATGDSYLLRCGAAGWSQIAPPTEQVARYVRAALASKGLYEAPPGTPANLSIEVSYGMDPSQRKVVSKVDPLSQPPPWPTNRTIVVDPLTSDQPLVRNREGYLVTTSVTVTTRKFMRISARETGGASARRELWSVEVTNNDESREFAAYVPLMIAAAMDALKPSTTGRFAIDLARDDERVAFVRGKK